MRFEDVYNEYVAEPDKWEVQGGNNMCYILDQIENRGINKGVKQGRLEGSIEKLEEIILNMLEANLPDEQIKTYTGVTPKELEKIKEKVACAVTE